MGDVGSRQGLHSLLVGLSEEVRAFAAAGCSVPRVPGTLSPLDFLREYVAQNRPAVLVGAAAHWPAVRLWSSQEYLEQALSGAPVHVAFTPDGRGDAVVRAGQTAKLLPLQPGAGKEGGRGPTSEGKPAHEDLAPECEGVVLGDEGQRNEGFDVAGGGLADRRGGERERSPTSEGGYDALLPSKAEAAEASHWFATPMEVPLPLGAFLRLLSDSRRDSSLGVPYVQHQNSSLTGEFAALVADVAGGLPFASAALGGPPEASNLWMGDERAETSWHKDHYENLYVVVQGRKHFRLLPPCDLPAMCVRRYPAASYWRPQATQGPFLLHPDAPRRSVPWASVDADLHLLPGLEPTARARLGPLYTPTPLHAILEPGDVLYLPSMWYHHVTQTPAAHGPTIAVNFWYDMAFDSKYAYYNLVDGITSIVNNEKE